MELFFFSMYESTEPMETCLHAPTKGSDHCWEGWGGWKPVNVSLLSAFPDLESECWMICFRVSLVSILLTMLPQVHC